jgi:hypothetical protein
MIPVPPGPELPPDQPAWQSGPTLPAQQFVGPALQTIPETKTFALEQAVDCSRWLELHDAADPAAAIVKVAQTFEEYLTGKETP